MKKRAARFLRIAKRLIALDKDWQAGDIVACGPPDMFGKIVTPPKGGKVEIEAATGRQFVFPVTKLRFAKTAEIKKRIAYYDRFAKTGEIGGEKIENPTAIKTAKRMVVAMKNWLRDM